MQQFAKVDAMVCAVDNSMPSEKTDQAINYIKMLDLGYIIQKMMAPTYPLPRWTLEDATRCCNYYKNFLILHVKYPKIAFVPTRYIDEFWHNHILYTQRYTNDCNNIFGHYLHHYPAEENADEILKLKNAFEITQQLYLKEFNEPLVLLNGYEK